MLLNSLKHLTFNTEDHMSATQYYGTGRRKTSTARVFLKAGSGNLVIKPYTFSVLWS